MPLDEFIRTRITDPLGMKDTTFFLPSEKRNRLAAVYSSGTDGTHHPRAGRPARAGRSTSTVRARASRAAPGCSRRRATTRGSWR